MTETIIEMHSLAPAENLKSVFIKPASERSENFEFQTAESLQEIPDPESKEAVSKNSPTKVPNIEKRFGSYINILSYSLIPIVVMGIISLFLLISDLVFLKSSEYFSLRVQFNFSSAALFIVLSALVMKQYDAILDCDLPLSKKQVKRFQLFMLLTSIVIFVLAVQGNTGIILGFLGVIAWNLIVFFLYLSGALRVRDFLIETIVPLQVEPAKMVYQF